MFLGDVHFRSDKPYWRKACEEFLEWFRTWKENNKDNALILLGDLVDTSVNGGTVIEYLERFYNYSNFKEIHICVGNHDVKKINGETQLAYEFYLRKPNVFIYKESTEVKIGDKKALFCPYYLGQDKNGLTMSEKYSHISTNKKLFSNDYDFVVGHMCGEDCSYPGAIDCISNLDDVSGRVILGHIHSRFTNPRRYIGSVFAEKKNENDSSRCYFYLEGDTWGEVKLPVFNEFINVSYPNELPNTDAIVPIYTILNCKDEKTARELYGDIYIRKVTINATESIKNKLFEDQSDFNSIKNFDIMDLFEEYILLKKDTLQRESIEECRKALSFN